MGSTRVSRKGRDRSAIGADLELRRMAHGWWGGGGVRAGGQGPRDRPPHRWATKRRRGTSSVALTQSVARTTTRSPADTANVSDFGGLTTTPEGMPGDPISAVER